MARISELALGKSAFIRVDQLRLVIGSGRRYGESRGAVVAELPPFFTTVNEALPNALFITRVADNTNDGRPMYQVRLRDGVMVRGWVELGSMSGLVRVSFVDTDGSKHLDLPSKYW